MSARRPDVGEIDRAAAQQQQALDLAAYDEDMDRARLAASPRRRRDRRRQFGFKSINARPGMHVELAAAKGYTRPGLLKLPYRFQVPPTEAFTRQLAYAHTDFDTVRAGQHSRPQARQLQVVSFQTLVVDWDATFAVWPRGRAVERMSMVDRYELFNVLHLTETLEHVLESGTPVRLRAGMPYLWDQYDVEGLYTLRNLTIEERGGEPDARYLDVELHEYRPLQLRRRSYGRAGRETTRSERGKADKLPTTIEVFADGSARDRGDDDRKISDGGLTIARLSKRYYGSHGFGRYIIRANTVLRQHNWPANQGLGGLSRAHLGGAPFKLKIPVAVD